MNDDIKWQNVEDIDVSWSDIAKSVIDHDDGDDGRIDYEEYKQVGDKGRNQ